MLARLQQFITLTWLATLLGWLAWQGNSGHTMAAAAGAALLVFGHAAWLAAGFLLASVINRSDPGPVATLRQWVLAWWREVWTAPKVFLWRQPFRSRREPDHLPPEAQGRRGVVLVHGFICNRGLWNPWMRQLRLRGHPFVAVNLEPVFGPIDDYIPRIEAAVQCLEVATGAPPLLVGHSMGGLAIRAWLQAHSADARIHSAVTVGTPHRGTWLARWALTDNGRQMRIGSDWLTRLAAQEPPARAGRFTCYFSACDNIVFPASGACLPGARLHAVPAAAHIDLIHHPEVMADVLGRLGCGGHGGEPIPL